MGLRCVRRFGGWFRAGAGILWEFFFVVLGFIDKCFIFSWVRFWFKVWFGESVVFGLISEEI